MVQQMNCQMQFAQQYVQYIPQLCGVSYFVTQATNYSFGDFLAHVLLLVFVLSAIGYFISGIYVRRFQLKFFTEPRLEAMPMVSTAPLSNIVPLSPALISTSASQPETTTNILQAHRVLFDQKHIIHNDGNTKVVKHSKKNQDLQKEKRFKKFCEEKNQRELELMEFEERYKKLVRDETNDLKNTYSLQEVSNVQTKPDDKCETMSSIPNVQKGKAKTYWGQRRSNKK